MNLELYMANNKDNMNSLPSNSILQGKDSRYMIETVLGHGTFGVTYKAKVIEGNRKGEIVTIKEFFVDGVSSREESGIVSSYSDTISIDQCKAEFVAEAKNLIILNHPNIVKAYEVFETNGTVYYSMEYIEGENLNSYLKRVNLTPDEAIKIITKIAYGLSYMHESRHMLHLDLKPGNVMRRSSDGQIILIDFGLSRLFSEKEMPETAMPVGLGTRGYAPVEQIDFKRQKKNFKATIDVYALGATFYKLVTGETPPPSKELMSNPESLRNKLASIDMPERNKQIIEKAMSPTPDKRYQSVMSFIYDINADERKRRKKGCWLSVLIAIIILVVLQIGNIAIEKHQYAKQSYYESLDGYAFELTEFVQGANHYGEREYYKFFSNRTGFYLFESWHDEADCNELNCNLENRTDTMTFKYIVKDHNKIIFEKGLKADDDKGQSTIVLDVVNREILVDEDDYLLQVNDETINWDEVMKIIE